MRTTVPRNDAKNYGMQSSALIANEGSEAWQRALNQSARIEISCGEELVGIEQVLCLCDWGQSRGDQLAVDISEAYLRVVERRSDRYQRVGQVALGESLIAS